MPMRRSLGILFLAGGLLLLSSGRALAAPEENEEFRAWEEQEIQLPAPPKQQNLVSFYVSATTDNRFFVDPDSLSAGKDGVLRYSLIVLTSAGVSNVTYEGMRCQTRERRIYAFGRGDGTWSKARNSKWEKVREAATNRHHAALFQEYFCPGGVIVASKTEALEAFRRGGPSRVPVAQW